MTTPRIRAWWRLLVAALTVAGPAAWLVVPGTAQAASRSTLTWSTVSPPSAPPALRYASAAYDSDNQTVVVFGGVLPDGSLSNATWVWDGSTWTSFTANPAPAGRQLASMAFDPQLHQLILFGGRGASGLLNDTWAWNGASWYQLNPIDAPTARAGAPMAYDHTGNLVLFGGTGPPSTSPTSATTATPPGNTSPSTPASSGEAGPDASGAGSASTGLSIPTTLDDTWIWTGQDWSQSAATGPSARTGATMAYDGASGQTVMFGGASSPGGGGLLSETWTWDGSGWMQQSPSASPPARAYAVEAYDTVTGTTVLTGGAGDGAALSDTWTWNNTTWSSVDPSSSPPARVGAAGAYDAGGRQLVVFGGAGKGGSALDDTVILTAEAPLVITPGATSPAPPGSGSANSSGTATGPISSSVSPSTSRPGTTPVSRTATPRAATSYNVHRGDLVTLTGSGFEPGTDITITFHSTPYVVGHTLAGAAGDFRVTVGVPERAAIGRHHFIAQGAGASGQLTELVTAVQVVPFAGGPSRRSPVQTAVMVFVAVAIPVGSWFALSLAGRLRRRSRHRSPARAVPRP